MDPWIYQKNYPLVTCIREYALGTVRMTQNRFLSEPDFDDTRNYQWYIPITWTLVAEGVTDFQNTYNEDFLMPDDSIDKSLGVNDDPLIVNIQSTGYYRVNYDPENWNRIINYLKSPNFTDINRINRAQLLSDSYALAEANIEAWSLPRTLSEYLVNEYDYVPFSMGITLFQLLSAKVNPNPEALQMLTNLQNLITDRYLEVGVDSDPTDSFIDLLYKREVVSEACGYDQPDCVAAARAVFDQWKQAADPDDPAENPVNINLRYPIYCTCIRNGDDSDKTFLEERQQNTFVPQEYNAISSALEC